MTTINFPAAVIIRYRLSRFIPLYHLSTHPISSSSCNIEGRCARLSFSTFGLGVGVGDAFRVANTAFEKEKEKKADK